MDNFALCLLAALACCAFSAPTGDIDVLSAIDYLTQFNYMGDNNPDAEMASQTTEEQFHEALRRFQAMAHIPETGVLDADTIDMMGRRRCGVPDVTIMTSISNRKRRYLIEGGSWNDNSITYRLENYTPDMNAGDVISEIDRAFRVWSDNSGLSFTRISSGTADIMIKFATGNHGDGNSFDGPGGVLAHAYFPRYGGDAHFDDDETYTLNTYSGTNLFQVAAHEFGHSLGLGHSSVQNALMAPFYAGYQPNFQLHSDDIQGIQAIYGANTGSGGSGGGGSSGGGNPPTTTTTTTSRPPSPPVDTDYCSDGRFDAVTTTDDGSTYGFRGSNYYKIDGTGVTAGYPKSISGDWPNLPNNVDAAVYWPRRVGWAPCTTSGSGWCYGTMPGETFFLKGSRMYKYVDRVFKESRLINDWIEGLPSNIDAAFVWNKNGRTYFVKGDQYYRATTGTGNSVHSGYPRPLSVWWSYSDTQFQNTITHLDAAVQYTNERTYFFMDGNYYRFNDDSFKIDEGYPRDIAYWWYGCRTSGNLDVDAGNVDPDDDSNYLGGGGIHVEGDSEVHDPNGAVTMTTTLTMFSTCVLMAIAMVL